MKKACIVCQLLKSDDCTALCPSYIAMHGHSGKGGRVASANIPKQYRGVTAATSIVRESEPQIYAVIDQYVKTFKRQFDEDGEQIKGLYLYSPQSGNGKTTTAAAIANEYLVRHYIGSVKRGLPIKQRPVYFLDVNEWQSTYNQFARQHVPAHIAEPAAAKYYSEEQYAMYADFLVIDDIGVRSSTEGFRNDLHKIINYRNVEELPTVYTSNVPLNELVTVFSDNRIVDRIRDMTEYITFTGTKSNRGRRK